MLAFVLSTALVAATSATPAAPTAPSTAIGQSEATTQFLEQYDNGQLRPVRVRRPVTIGFETGSNGFGGSGLHVSYNMTPHWSVDAGGGLGMAGARAGVRGRYNFLTSYWTPFAALGASYLFALDSEFGTYTDPWAQMPGYRVDFNSDKERKASYKVQSAPSASALFGMSYQGPGGFSFMAGLGWSQLLDRKSNIVVTDGSLSAQKRTGLDLTHGSGPVADLMFGYSF